MEKPGLHVTGGGDSGLTPNRQYMLVSYAQTCASKESSLIWYDPLDTIYSMGPSQTDYPIVCFSRSQTRLWILVFLSQTDSPLVCVFL